MGLPSNATPDADGAASGNLVHQFKDWSLARDAHRELLGAGVQRTNLFLVGNGAVSILLDMLGLDQQSEPILRWRSGQSLDLPSLDGRATLVLHDVHDLGPDDQQRLLQWLDQTGGRVRIVSTTGAPLWPRVRTGEFDEVLYYRLNIVYVDVVSPAH